MSRNIISPRVANRFFRLIAHALIWDVRFLGGGVEKRRVLMRTCRFERRVATIGTEGRIALWAPARIAKEPMKSIVSVASESYELGGEGDLLR